MKKIIIVAAAALVLAAVCNAENNANAAVIANAASVSATKSETKTVTFKVGLHCKNCVKKVTENISFAKGVKDLKVSLENKTVTVTYDPAKTDVETLRKAIEKLGYTAEVQK